MMQEDIYIDNIPCKMYGQNRDCFFGLEEICGDSPCIFVFFRVEKHSLLKNNGHSLSCQGGHRFEGTF